MIYLHIYPKRDTNASGMMAVITLSGRGDVGLQSLRFVVEVGLSQLALGRLGQEAIETLLGNRTLS